MRTESRAKDEKNSLMERDGQKKATLIQRLSQSARRPIYSSLAVSDWGGGGCQSKLLFSHFRPEGTYTWKVASVACQVTVAETAPCFIGF